jgi:hypothetical protein
MPTVLNSALSRRAGRRLALAALVAVALSGCASALQSAERGFSNLLSGSTPTAELDAPALYAFESADQAREAAGWLDPDSASSLLGADYKSSAVIMAFWGPNPSSGYGLEIQDISISGKDVRLTARLEQPDPSSAQSDVITFAYHAITVPRAAVDLLSGVVISLYDTDGNLVAKTTIP